jgi:hypothetical protein
VDAAAATPPALALLCAAGPTGRRVARAVAAARRAGAPVALVTLANKGAAGEGTDTLPPGLGRHFAGLTAMITALGGVTSSPQPGESPGVETAGETVQPAMTETVP